MNYLPFNFFISIQIAALLVCFLPWLLIKLRKYLNVQATVMNKKIVLYAGEKSKRKCISYANAECKMKFKTKFNQKAFKSVAQTACQKMLDADEKLKFAIVWFLVDQRTLHYVARSSKDHKEVPHLKDFFTPNSVGTHAQVRGKLSGLRAQEFLNKFFVPKKPILVRQSEKFRFYSVSDGSEI